MLQTVGHQKPRKRPASRKGQQMTKQDNKGQLEKQGQEIPPELTLTEVEREELAESNADLLQCVENALNGGNIGLNVALGRLRRYRANKLTPEEVANTVATHLVQDSTKAKQGSLLSLIGYLPHDMTRVSPFFPLQTNRFGQRKYLQNIEISSGDWGKLTYKGPQLTIYDEDVLITLLCVINNAEFDKYIQEVKKGRQTAYRYKGPMLPFLNILLDNKKPGAREYARFFESCETMISTCIKLELSSGKTKTGKKRENKTVMGFNLINFAMKDEETGEFSVELNPYFYHVLANNSVLSVDIKTRMGLKGAICKALHRFIISHKQLKGNIPFKLSTIVGVLNMDASQPEKQQRRLLKKAIEELQRHGILTSDSGFIDQNHLKFVRPKKKSCLPSNP